MRPSNVRAIFMSDVHLSHTAPAARSREKWYDVMERQWAEVGEISYLNNNCPIFIAGDVFNVWDSPVELVNFAIDVLPANIYAVPGQHDLPNHRYDEKYRSAYGTLVRSGKVVDLLPDMVHRIAGMEVQGFPWGYEVDSVDHARPRSGLRVAVIHSFIWKDTKTGFPGADEKKKVVGYGAALADFDVAVFGDNHIHFMDKVSECQVINCGTFFRRRSDERTYQPKIGLLTKDDEVIPYSLDVSKDLFLEEPLAKAREEQEVDTSRVLADLKSLSVDSLDYKEAVRQHLDREGYRIDDRVRQLVQAALEGR